MEWNHKWIFHHRSFRLLSLWKHNIRSICTIINVKKWICWQKKLNAVIEANKCEGRQNPYIFLILILIKCFSFWSVNFKLLVGSDGLWVFFYEVLQVNAKKNIKKEECTEKWQTLFFFRTLFLLHLLAGLRAKTPKAHHNLLNSVYRKEFVIHEHKFHEIYNSPENTIKKTFYRQEIWKKIEEPDNIFNLTQNVTKIILGNFIFLK